MKRRNNALTVLFSLIPGAGQMFQGFMNTGLLLLAIFFGVIFFASLFDLYIICLALPVIWCYSFFDSINKMNHDDEEFYELKDDFPFDLNPIKKSGAAIKIIAVILILTGFFSLWNIIYMPLNNYIYGTEYNFPHIIYYLVDMLSYVPRLSIAILIIVVGICLIRKKKKELNVDDTDNT